MVSRVGCYLVLFLDEKQGLSEYELKAALPDVELHAATGLQAGLSLLQAHRVNSPVVLADIGSRGGNAIEDIRRIAAETGNGRLIVCGAANDIQLYRMFRQVGVEEYCTYPLEMDELSSLLGNSPVQLAAHAGISGMSRSAGGKAFAFLSAASGDGSTTIALNTAWAIASEYRLSTVIVDMDYQFGAVARHFDLHAPFGISDIFAYPDRGMDETLLRTMLINRGSHLKVIAAPDVLNMVPEITPHAVEELVTLLRSMFDVVIFDVPHRWEPWVIALLRQVDHTVVVSQLWLRSLTHFSRILAAWREAAINKTNILLAVNRSGAKFKEAISPQDFERVSNKPIDAFMANDIKTIAASENEGKTVFEVPPSLFQKQIRDLAAQLLQRVGVNAARVNEAISQVAPKPKFGFFAKVVK